MSKRQSWLDKVTATEVNGMSYADCAAMQERTGFEGAQYETALAAMKAVAVEVGLVNPTGTLCRLHALITAKALPVITKRLEFGA